MCREQLMAHTGAVLIVAGDSPLTQADSVRALLDQFDRQEPACLIGTAKSADPTGLGRMVRDADGKFLAVVEHKDATAEQRQIAEVNMSTYVFAAAELLYALDRLTTDNNQQEYYITDCPGILRSEGKTVLAECLLQPCEALSINTTEDLAAVEAEMKRQA